MLVLSRSVNEGIMLGDDMEIVVLAIGVKSARLAVKLAAPGGRITFEDVFEVEVTRGGESASLPGKVTCDVVDILNDKVRLGICAPTHLSVHRREVYEAIRRENRRDRGGQ